MWQHIGFTHITLRAKSMIDVLIDTNILHQEGLFSRNMQLLSRLAQAEMIKIFIPDLVKKEYLTKRLSDAEASLKSAQQKILEILKKTDRRNPIYDSIQESRLSIVAAAKDIHKAIEKDFETWCESNRVVVVKFDANLVESVFDDYFSGKGVFRQPKSRDDIPDAFINLSVQELLREKGLLDVIIKDGVFSQHLQKTVGVSVFDDLEKYLQSQKTTECIDILDKRSKQTEALKEFFSGDKFKSYLLSYLRQAEDLVSSIYIEDGSIENTEIIELESAYGANINWPVAKTVNDLELESVSQIEDGHFSIKLRFQALSPVSFCADFAEWIRLPEDRQLGISESSMNGDGISDLTENYMATLEGHAELRFEPEHSIETLISASEYLDSDQSKIKIELDMQKATLLERADDL
ncbi:PIN domain-containing protein [Herbaspirillum huttiense]|uniref:PIN domain-containing protein n=1 Tax=Herbaspirillum huttiense TaxID=863372 RepID=UPI003B3B832A